MKRVGRIALLLACTILVTGCSEKIGSGDHEVQRKAVEGVGIETVNPVEKPEYVEVAGTIKSRNTALVSAKLMGSVSEIPVEAGDRIKKGDLLLRLHSPDIDAKVRAAEEAREEAVKGLTMAKENAQLAQKTFERYKKLFEEKAVTGQEFDEIRTRQEVARLQYESAESALRRAEAALEEAKAFSDYAVIRSPLSGIVAEKNIDVGSMTSPGVPLFAIEEPSYRAEVPVDEGLISLIRTGMPVAVTVDSLNLSLKGTVDEIVRQIDPGTRTFTVKIAVGDDSGALRGGLYVSAELPVGGRSVLYVPEESIVTRGELKGVYVVGSEGIMTWRLVKTGKKRDSMTEVISGLSAGEKIIVSGVEKAVDGGVVK